MNPQQGPCPACEREIGRWSGFANPLRRDDRQAFYELMDMGRNCIPEIKDTAQPAKFEQLVISIIIAQRIRIIEIEKTLNTIRPDPATPPQEKKTNLENQRTEAVHFKKKKPGGEQTRLS
jgi:hypothetical protein